MKSAGRPPCLTFDQYRRLLEVRDARKAIPVNKQLAREFDVPVSVIRAALSRGVKTYDFQLRAKHGRESEG